MRNKTVNSVQLCLTLCNPMDCSMLGFPVHHQLPELAQTHVYQVSDAIQPSHPLSSPSPPTFNLSQHQGLFKWVSSSHQVSKVLSFSFSICPSDEYSRLKKRREAKGKGEKERHTHLNAEFQRIARRDTLGRPRGMVWGGRREEGSGWGTNVYLWWIHFDIWQN